MTESPMVISAISPWFGSKRTLAPVIVQELGPHRGYWEPFCGSMSVLLAKPQSSNETVNDLHGALINMARVVQHATLGPAFYRSVRRTWFHEDLFTAAAERQRARKRVPAGELDLDWAVDTLICDWIGRNGVAGTNSYNQGFCVRYTNNGGHAATRWESLVSSIPAWRRRLRHVMILNRDGFELIERIDDSDGMVMYVDPPYLEKGAKYVHDFEPSDHERLAKLLHRFEKTRVVVSYYEHPALADLYPRWTKRSCPTTKAMVSAGQRDQRGGAVKAPEVLLINGPSYTSDGLF